jgi:hypothetical protein
VQVVPDVVLPGVQVADKEVAADRVEEGDNPQPLKGE